MLRKETIEQASEAIAGAVLRRDALEVDRVILEPVSVLGLSVPRVLHLVGLAGQLAGAHYNLNGQEGDDGDHEHVEPAPVV